MDRNGRNLRVQIENEAKMLVGCKNRMCITDDVEELARLHKGAVYHAGRLFELNLERLQGKGGE